MENNRIKIVAKFYLKSGLIVEDYQIAVSEDESISITRKIKSLLEANFIDEYNNMSIVFGDTVLRTADVSAVTFETNSI